MSEREIKYPVKNKTAHDVQQQMGRITDLMGRRVRRLEHKGDLYAQDRSVGIKTTASDGTTKMLEVDATKGYNRESSYLRKRVGQEDEQTSLDISSVAADTMHGWILKGTVTDPETGAHNLAGDETIHHLALNMAELRGEIVKQEAVNKDQIQASNTTAQNAKQAALNKLYK